MRNFWDVKILEKWTDFVVWHYQDVKHSFSIHAFNFPSINEAKKRKKQRGFSRNLWRFFNGIGEVAALVGGQWRAAFLESAFYNAAIYNFCVSTKKRQRAVFLRGAGRNRVQK